MALSIEEKKDMGEAPSLIADKPKFPCGLQLRMCNRSLKKLGIDKAPGIGESFMIMARVEVIGVNADQDDDDTKEFNVALQITDMEIEKKEEKKESADSLFYSGN